MALIPFNRYGLFGLETIDAKVENNSLIFVFEAHPYVNTPYNGLLLIHFKNPAPSTASADMPVFFETRGISGTRKAVTKAGNVPMTAADLKVPCYLQFFYDFRSGVLEALASVQPTEE